MAQPTLTWGVKQSFRSYVQGAGGSIRPGDEVALAPDGAFVFAAAPGSSLGLGADGRPQGEGRFQGQVQFEAHGGMLSVFLADPAVEIGPDAAVLTVFDTPSRNRRVALAVLDLAAAGPGEGGELVIPARMSMEGWQVLGDHYPPNTPIDPVRLAFG